MEEKRKIVPFLVMLIVTQVSIVIGGLVGAIKGFGLFKNKYCLKIIRLQILLKFFI